MLTVRLPPVLERQVTVLQPRSERPNLRSSAMRLSDTWGHGGTNGARTTLENRYLVAIHPALPTVPSHTKEHVQAKLREK